MNDLKTTNETFDTNEIENNTKALQELKKALESYQASLNSTSTTQTTWLDQIKKIIVVMDTFKTITTNFKNVGRGKMFPSFIVIVLKMPTLICVLRDTEVFILTFVKYTNVNEASICGETGTL